MTVEMKTSPDGPHATNNAAYSERFEGQVVIPFGNDPIDNHIIQFQWESCGIAVSGPHSGLNDHHPKRDKETEYKMGSLLE